MVSLTSVSSISSLSLSLSTTIPCARRSSRDAACARLASRLAIFSFLRSSRSSCFKRFSFSRSLRRSLAILRALRMFFRASLVLSPLMGISIVSLFVLSLLSPSSSLSPLLDASLARLALLRSSLRSFFFCFFAFSARRLSHSDCTNDSFFSFSVGPRIHPKRPFPLILASSFVLIVFLSFLPSCISLSLSLSLLE